MGSAFGLPCRHTFTCERNHPHRKNWNSIFIIINCEGRKGIKGVDDEGFGYILFSISYNHPAVYPSSSHSSCVN